MHRISRGEVFNKEHLPLHALPFPRHLVVEKITAGTPAEALRLPKAPWACHLKKVPPLQEASGHRELRQNRRYDATMVGAICHCMYVYIYIEIYIYRERERGREA